MDLTRRPAGKWIVDFGWEMSEADAALYEAPFGYVREHVWPKRQKNRAASLSSDSIGGGMSSVRAKEMWQALDGLTAFHRDADGFQAPAVHLARCGGLPRPPTHRHRPRRRYVTFGILHSRFHEAWSLRLGTMARQGQRSALHADHHLRDLPLPGRPLVGHSRRRGLRAHDPRAAAIADAARRLVELRDRWLNPPEWVEWVEELAPGYPKRPVARDEAAGKKLKARTLTNLYNARPQWLADAHAVLDDAVAAAYGWDAGLSEEDALRNLLALNAAGGKQGTRSVKKR